MSEGDEVRTALRDAMEEALDMGVNVDEILCMLQRVTSDRQVSTTREWCERQQRRG